MLFFKGGCGRVGLAGLAENICWPYGDPNFKTLLQYFLKNFF